MVGFKHFVIGMLLVGLFAYALINAGILLGYYNDGNSIADSLVLSSFKANISTQLENSYSTANSTEASFGDSPISLTQIIFVDALGGLWKTLKTIPTTIFNLLTGIVGSTILPSSEFFILYSVIGAIIIITIIFGVWKLISTGDAED